jgi:succinate-semialdehyde dehydrogenase / glutarate-semialdehyde dehydrogenase
MKAVDPASGKPLTQYPEMGWEEVELRLEGCHQAFVGWRDRSFDQRAEPMRRAGALLRERQDAYARLMAQEMGKPVRAGRAEVDKCAWVCDHYAEHAAALLAPEVIPTEARRSYVAFQPLGVVFAIMPWNFPFWQVLRFAAPALMAGNAAVLKHAENVPGCALALETLLRDAGFPEHLLTAVRVDRELAGRIIGHPRVRAVTLTGSTAAGRAVARQAGEALKKTVLELGGSDPYVVLADADPAEAARVCVEGRMVNGGQSCIAAKRFIVVPAVRVPFEREVLARMRAISCGSPLDDETTLGPMARQDLRDALHRQVQDSVAAGARLLLGGEVPDRPGAWYPPTVLTDVGPGMPAHDEELFGPVAAILPARDDDDALRIANDSVYGLGAAVLTADAARGEALARERLEAGCCFVNDFVRSDPRLPFGGVKDSGYGRELGALGIREFVNAKTVWVA